MPVLQMRDLRQEAILSRSHGHNGCGGIAGLSAYSVSPMLFWNPHTDLIRRHFPSHLTEGETGVQIVLPRPQQPVPFGGALASSLLLGVRRGLSWCSAPSPHSPWGERSCHPIQAPLKLRHGKTQPRLVNLGLEARPLVWATQVTFLLVAPPSSADLPKPHPKRKT